MNSKILAKMILIMKCMMKTFKKLNNKLIIKILKVKNKKINKINKITKNKKWK
jgi:hypothetical protein